MHFYDIEGFRETAKQAGHENTSEHYLQVCAENDVVFSIAMGNADGETPVYGGSTPRVPDLAGKFNYKEYNQPKVIGYCCGVKSDELTLANAEKTAAEFEALVYGYNNDRMAESQREELYNQPKLLGLNGPMFNGFGTLKSTGETVAIIRYEKPSRY